MWYLCFHHVLNMKICYQCNVHCKRLSNLSKYHLLLACFILFLIFVISFYLDQVLKIVSITQYIWYDQENSAKIERNRSNPPLAP